MDQHPIPQDVTGFQFKLIGTMTVKQFGYVACGVILAVITYYLPLQGFFWVLAKIILIPLLGGSGVVVAFVPIEGRPVDVMATNFFKAIFAPNQYVYRKQGKQFSFSKINVAPVVATTGATAAAAPVRPVTQLDIKQKEITQKEEKLHAFLESSHKEVKTALDQKELSRLSSLSLPYSLKSLPRPATAGGTAKPAIATAHTPTPAQTSQLKHITPAAHPVPATNPTPMPTPTPAATASITTPPAVIAAPTPAATQPPAPQTPDQHQKEMLTQKETQLEKDLQTAKTEENTTHTAAAHEKVTVLEKQVQEIHSQKLQLEKELEALKTQLTAQKGPQPQAAAPVPAPPAPVANTVQRMPDVLPPTPPATTVVPSPQPTQPPAQGMPASQYAKTITPTAAVKADLPKISDTPNVVVGIVKDPRGNILPNMLVEVKDKDGNPVRAFKTNPLGQFASATPLAPGIYTIELDDPKKQHQFDVIQITANNQIMLPIEIISHDAREELRKQLFN